jgi:hypothetical protein
MPALSAAPERALVWLAREDDLAPENVERGEDDVVVLCNVGGRPGLLDGLGVLVAQDAQGRRVLGDLRVPLGDDGRGGDDERQRGRLDGRVYGGVEVDWERVARRVPVCAAGSGQRWDNAAGWGETNAEG